MVQPVLTLASQSPRRRQMLAWTGLEHTVHPADLDESRLPEESPCEYVARLAAAKARVTALQTGSAGLILAADTIVADGDTLLGKPANAQEAREMLLRLRGRTHQVYTALALLEADTQKLYEDRCVSQVNMRDYSTEEIETYIMSGDPMDKAGGYAIQNGSFHPVVNFQGCFASVMGLPLCHLVRTLKKIGVIPPLNVPQTCQAQLGYDCPISTAILNGENAG